jgi:UDP-N-acetylglucosamine--N-acetylmuramyl-(pentapeptide) pyrophosphoryl-undecaprenol N-acetylglucosamine transferase
LVPYPYAWHYQRVNASYLVRHGAAVQIEDSELAEQIITMVRDLIEDKDRLERMSKAMYSLAKPAAAERIANLLKEQAVAAKQTGSHHVPDQTD